MNIIAEIGTAHGGSLEKAYSLIGAAVDNESDTGSMMMPVTLVVLFALYAGIYSATNPDGPLAFWCSIIPFTSPMYCINAVLSLR